MRIPGRGVCLLGVVWCGFVGCSQTGGLRSNDPTELKTVASVNGKPLPTVAGEPGLGSSIRTETDDLDPPPAAGSRISGRVFDEQGRAVPNAMVRLGVGKASGGRVNFARTDRSGAFTLHGLRPGSTYTLIAEYQGEDGMMSGRADARAPQSNVRIGLGARDSGVESQHSLIRPPHAVSSLFKDDDAEGDEFPAAARPRVARSEDDSEPEPSAEDAASSPRGASRPSTSRLAADTAPGPIRAGWTPGQRRAPAAAAAGEATSRPRKRAEVDDPPSPREPAGAEDDGENPLPPALEPGESRPARPAVGPAEAPLSRYDGRPSTARLADRSRRPTPAEAADAGYDDRPADDQDPRSSAAPRQLPDDALPASGGVATASYSGDERSDSLAESEPPARPSRPVRRGARAASTPAPGSRDATDAADSPEAVDSAEASPPPARPSRRPTWRQLSISPDEVPVDEALHRSSAEESLDDRDLVIRAGGPAIAADESGRLSTAAADEPGRLSIAGADEPGPAAVEPARPRRRRLLGAARPAEGGDQPPARATPGKAVCRFDSTDRRIVDLRLPGLDGKMVSLHDIDADVIVLDFWGSWCVQCRKSVEHHRRIQEELSGRRVQVIGIACEKAPTFEGRRDAAAAAAKKLAINYPVLVTTMDGECPIQKALQVQFYPTMVVLDREGRVLHLEQGATDVTLGRTDRSIAKALRDIDGSRVE